MGSQSQKQLSNFHFLSYIHTWLLEKSYLWSYGPLSAKWCLCFLVHWIARLIINLAGEFDFRGNNFKKYAVLKWIFMPLKLFEMNFLDKVLLPKNWICLLVSAKPKNTTTTKTEGRIYILQQVRRTPEIFTKAVSGPKTKWASFKLKVHAYLWNGLVDRVQAWVDWSHNVQKTSTSFSLGF